ncbi:MAG: hypothetical protein L6V85_06720 [Clostridiales bacterium]|nr:MAG: hypothetical protein L6V85_06720 [Clostridiales bacterium]
MNKLQQKLLDLKISKKLPFWCIAPALIICVFVIVFAVTGAKNRRGNGLRSRYRLHRRYGNDRYDRRQHQERTRSP